MSYQGDLLMEYDFQLVDSDNAKNINLAQTEKDNDPLLRSLKKDDVVFDIGFHIGGFALAAAQLCEYVYGFEPNPLSFRIGERNITTNAINNIFVHNVGLSDSEEQAVLLVDNERSMNCSIYHKRTLTGRPYVIELKPLLYYLNLYHPTILKIDCEGCEYEMVRAYSKHFKDMGIRMLFIEYHLDNVGVVQVIDNVRKGKREDTEKYKEYIRLMSVDYEIHHQDWRDLVNWTDAAGVERQQLRNGTNCITWKLKQEYELVPVTGMPGNFDIEPV